MVKKYIFAFDRAIKKRVTHILENGLATSMVSGTTFKYVPKRKKK